MNKRQQIRVQLQQCNGEENPPSFLIKKSSKKNIKMNINACSKDTIIAPKTRVTPEKTEKECRLIFSPRLKNFPPEEIKKNINVSQENVSEYVNNSGEGDVLDMHKFSPAHQNQQLSSENNQPCIVPFVPQAGDCSSTHQPELIVSPQNLTVKHRPHVPTLVSPKQSSFTDQIVSDTQANLVSAPSPHKIQLEKQQNQNTMKVESKSIDHQDLNYNKNELQFKEKQPTHFVDHHHDTLSHDPQHGHNTFHQQSPYNVTNQQWDTTKYNVHQQQIPPINQPIFTSGSTFQNGSVQMIPYQHLPYPYHGIHQQHFAENNQMNQEQVFRYQYPKYQQKFSHQPTNYQIQDPQQQQLKQEQKSKETKKGYQFTQEMIRDQELLINTMRQQGIPDDVMCHQFNALLNEQKRQLVCLDQLSRSDDENSSRKKITPTKQKVTKIYSNQKPEWMAHITPPRISFNDWEKMKTLSEETYYNQSSNNEKTKEMYIPYNQPIPSNWSTELNNYNYEPSQNSSTKLADIPHVYPYFHTPVHNGYYQQDMNTFNVMNPESTSTKNVSFQNEKAEPSSLLKLRMYKEVIKPQKRNNGLQNPEFMKASLNTLKKLKDKTGLEYLAKLDEKKPVVRLNGVQDPKDTIAHHSQPSSAFGHFVPTPKKISANGLENKRNPDNPVPLPVLANTKMCDDKICEYPRQKEFYTESEYQQPYAYHHQFPMENQPYDMSQYCEEMQHYEQYNQNNSRGDMRPTNYFTENTSLNPDKNIIESRKNLKHGVAEPNVNDSMYSERCDVNNINGWNRDFVNLQEPRIIGGVKYFARKSQVASNPPQISPDTFIAKKYIQPAFVY